MVILNESKVKYNKLDELFDEILLDIKFSSQINVIVDLKEIVKKYFRPDMLPEINNHMLLVEEIASDLINIIGHYRNYFYKKKKYTTFYFLYSFNECKEMKKILPSYKETYYEKYFRSKENEKKINVTKRALNAVKKVVSSLPNCNFIETSKFDEFCHAKYIIENSEKNEMNLILSNDNIFYQLLNEHTFLLNLKGIKSSLITRENAIAILLKKDEEELEGVTSDLIPLIISLSGDKKYSISSIGNVALNRAVKIVKKLLDDGKILSKNGIGFPIDISELNPKNKSEKLIIENIDLITRNYSIIRNDSLYFGNIIYIEEAFIKTPTLTPEMLLELNAKIFTNFPLQLDMLIRGEKV